MSVASAVAVGRKYLYVWVNSVRDPWGRNRETTRDAARARRVRFVLNVEKYKYVVHLRADIV